jgi:hypothetical protein
VELAVLALALRRAARLQHLSKESFMTVQAKNKKTYIFRMSGDQGYVTDYGVTLFNQILSTLKFIRR